MNYTQTELIEAKKQIASAIHKTRKVLETFEAKEHIERYKSQITLAKRRIMAFEISLALLEKESHITINDQ